MQITKIILGKERWYNKEHPESTKDILHSHGILANSDSAGGKLSMQGQTVNVLGSVSHRVFVIIIQLCPQSSHRQYVREWEWQCSNKTLFGKLDCRLDLPVGS